MLLIYPLEPTSYRTPARTGRALGTFWGAPGNDNIRGYPNTLGRKRPPCLNEELKRQAHKISIYGSNNE